MKIFWSWQSDTLGTIGRFFVRDTLKAAVEQLRRESEVIEPEERDRLHVDQDRMGVPGSPDLARVILDKIENAVVFVADVTPVAISIADPSKKHINSNVAIELGYALRALTDRALLMVMNEHYGSREDLPFDLRHKAGPITFNLAPDADKATIRAAGARLQAQLVEPIKLCIGQKIEDTRQQTAFAPVSKLPPGLFFHPPEILASAGIPGEQEFQFDSDKAIYLRLYPTFEIEPPGRSKMAALFDARKSCPFSTTIGGIPGRNKYGSIIFDYEGRASITAATQGFPSGELWGFARHMFSRLRNRNPLSGADEFFDVLPMISVEKIFVRALRNYLQVAKELELPFPFTVVVGAFGMDNVFLTVPGGPFNNGQTVGPLMSARFEQSFSLAQADDTAMMRQLGKVFTAFYDLATCSRAEVLTEDLVAAHDLPPF